MNTSDIIVTTDLPNARPYAYLYEELCVYFLRWYLPLTIIIGVLGTLFSLFFLFCSKLFQYNMLLWLSSICIGDFFILTLEGLWILLKVWFKFDIRDQNDVICKLHKASSNYAFYWSAYMQSALSVQRAYLVFKPLHARARAGVSRKHIIVWSVITFILLAPVAPYLIYWKVIEGDCDPTDRDIFYLTTLCDLIIWGIIPLLGMTMSTAVICLNMAKLGNKFKRRQAANSKWVRKFSRSSALDITDINPICGRSTSTQTFVRSKSTIDTSTLSTRIMDHLHHSEFVESRVDLSPLRLQRQSTEHNSSRHNAPDNFGHVTRLLICMNIAYMSSTFPLITFLMFRNFSGVEVDPDIHRFYYYLFRSLCFLNSCTNWIFYCLVGKLFREEAKHILQMCCGLSRKKGPGTQSNPTRKLLAPTMPVLGTPLVSQQASPVKRLRSVSAIEIQSVVTRIPAR